MSDEIETIESNPKSWVAWKREAERLQKIIDDAANREAQPVAWTVGGFASHDKKWAERRSAEENLLLEPLYRHPVVTGIDENHYDPELEPGLYVAEIMTKGGAAVINGYYTAPPAPAVPDNKAITPFFDNIALDTALMVMCDVNRRSDFLGGDVQLLSRIQCRIDDACRAAMLAQPVSQGCKLVPVEVLATASTLIDLCRTYTILNDTGSYKERTINDCENTMEMIDGLLAAPEGGNEK